MFRAYDIRGIYGKELKDAFGYDLGRAFASFVSEKTVLVGMDMRESSIPLKKELIRGLREGGKHVLDIGLCSTPLMNFASGTKKLPGVMVTASHNPKEYNGFKLMRAKAVPIGETSGLQELKKIIETKQYVSGKKEGTLQTIDIQGEYEAFMMSFLKLGRKLKLVFDCANGMGSIEMSVFKKHPELFDVVTLFEELDGSFPNHEANPLKYETLKDLQAKVQEVGADVGIAFDGDADRCGFVDEKGDIVEPSFVAALIASGILAQQKKKTVLYDLRSSLTVPETITSCGGKPKETRVGHAFIKEEMKASKAVFASELSGHYYFAANFNAESSALAVIFLLNALGGNTLSSLVSSLHKYVHSGEINIQVEEKQKVIDVLKERYADGDVSTLDGVKVSYAEWWFNVRASNTENVLRLVVEAHTKALMEEKRTELLNTIQSL